MKKNKHKIGLVEKGSIAEELEIEAGDLLVSINNQEIEDVFDYHYYTNEEYLELLIEKPDGEEWILEIEKEFEEDLGIEFENGLMDEYRSCRNKCVFCFIDQMPGNMRETLYFKDDDSRLSFLQGNYVTLTNMSDHDIERIIHYKLAPINISFHTMNQELRCSMLNNRFAGEALKKVDKLFEAGIEMNGQIVLCKGLNDKQELEYTIEHLVPFLPHLQSVSVVPVGLTKFRDGLEPLEAFNKEEAQEVLDCIHRWQEKLYKTHGTHFIHAGDEWYILAGAKMPEEETYDGYLQLENGVGMTRLLMNEVDAVLLEQRSSLMAGKNYEKLSIATGVLAYPYILRQVDKIRDKYPDIQVSVYQIENKFFGEKITVAGLLTGQDIVEQLKGRDLGERLLLSCNVLRDGEDVFLDDMTVSEMEIALQTTVNIVESSGQAFVEAVLKTL